jgi:hypothetical protein
MNGIVMEKSNAVGEKVIAAQYPIRLWASRREVNKGKEYQLHHLVWIIEDELLLRAKKTSTVHIPRAAKPSVCLKRL